MKIERIRADAFGRLADFDTGPDSLGKLVVVLGPNEAGKSTLFQLLTTLFHGFYPASRDRNPHIPWGTDSASGSMHLLLDDGAEAEVERRLKAAPSGRVRVGHHTMEVRNQAVPWVEHAPLRVFRQVYAVTLADLAALDPTTWGHVQDRIVGSMGSSDLHSVRSVAETLESESAAIWRPDRRGNQVLRGLQDDLRALRLRRSAARERDRLVRGLVEERENIRVSLRELREQKAEEAERLRRAEAARPLQVRLQRIETLRVQGGPREDLLGLTNDPPSFLDSLRTRRREHCQRASELTESLDEPSSVIEQFDARARSLVDRADELGSASRQVLEVASDRRRAEELSSELADHRQSLHDEGRRLFADGWREELRAPIHALSLPVLMERVARARSPEASAGQSGSAAPFVALAVVGVAAGIAGLLLAYVTGQVVGAAATAAGAMGWWSHRRARADGSADRGSDSVRHLLRDLPVRPEFLTPPGEPLTNALGTLSRTLESIERAERELAGASSRVETADTRIREIARPVLPGEHRAAPELADALQDEVRHAERLRDAAEHATKEVDRTTAERDRELHFAAEAGTELEAVVARLESLGEGDPDAGALRAQRRIAAHNRADQLQIESEREIGEAFPAVGEGSAIPDLLEDREIARARVVVDELTDRIEASIAREESLAKDIAHLGESETVDAVDSEIEALEAHASDLVRERDRKWALAHLLRTADRAFREAHQPDLLRRAGKHLSALTGGRYDRLVVDDSTPDQPFLLGGPQLPAPVPLTPPVSTGTLEQAYLSLRLAIIDHLDQGHETLPLFVDEVFVNWDAERRDRGLDLLGAISETRQLFVFTCHPELASQLEERGGRVLSLS